MANDKVIVEISLDDGSIQKGFAKVEKSGKSAGANIAKSFAKIGAVAAVAATALGAVFTARAVALAKEQENAVNNINTALRLTGKFSKEASQDLQDYAAALQQVTTVGDETTLETAALIQSLGNLSTQGLKRATTAAVDLSAALGIDLNAAALLVGKAAAGEISSFSRYGLILKKGKDNAETFSKALTALEQKFGGAAQAQVNTFAGATQQLSNLFGDLLENVGFIITKSPGLIAVLQVIGDRFLKAGEAVNKFAKNRDFIGAFISQLAGIGLAVNKFVVVPIEFAFGIIQSAAFNTLVVFQTVFDAFVQTFGAIGQFVAKLFGSDLPDGLKAFAAGSTEALDFFKQKAVETTAAVGNSFDFALSVDNFLVDIQRAVDESAPLFDQLGNSSAKGLGQIAKNTKKASFDLKSRIGGGIASTIQESVGALQRGEDAIAAFGKAALGVFGDLAIQLGTFFITEGIAVEALNAISGTGAIVAGIALVALGTLLKGASGGSGSTSPATSTPVGSAPGDTIGSPEIDEDIEVERSTAVTVNVEGAVLDPIGTGQAIVEVLQETFDTTGSQVVTNVA